MVEGAQETAISERLGYYDWRGSNGLGICRQAREGAKV